MNEKAFEQWWNKISKSHHPLMFLDKDEAKDVWNAAIDAASNAVYRSSELDAYHQGAASYVVLTLKANARAVDLTAALKDSVHESESVASPDKPGEAALD